MTWKTHRSLRAHTAAVGLAGALTVAQTCTPTFSDPNDPLLDGDALDLETSSVAEIVPGAPWIQPGADGELGTDDDVIRSDVVGDIDLVLRSGITHFVGPIPDPSARSGRAPLAVAEPFGLGTPVDFVVTASDGSEDTPYGNPVASPSLDGAPLFVTAFADLDGDGYIGITNLDGDLLDASIEEAELELVAGSLALTEAGLASGSLRIAVGGPPGAELRVALAAGAYTGALDSGFMNGIVPEGPAVMTELPFLPRLDPDRLIDTGGGSLWPVDPSRPAAVEVEPALEPDPNHPAIGEAFTLETDGSAPTIDLAVAHSGTFARFGLARAPDPFDYWASPFRPLRPGLDEAGSRTFYEILQRLQVDDDGGAGQVSARVVPLDRLGNVSDLEAGEWVTIWTSGIVRIAVPDRDGDPFFEVVWIPDARGAEVILDDAGGEFDDEDRDTLVVEGPAAIAQIDLFLPDPDVDDSGSVDARDLALVATFLDLRLGDPAFDPRFDLDGNGRIREADLEAVEAQLGRAITVP